MLTRLRFKNWRSLRDVEIDNLTPLTVFIGANSAGKSNILDALYFLRECSEHGVVRAVQERGGVQKIHTLRTPRQDPIEIEFTYRNSVHASLLSYTLTLVFEDEMLPRIIEVLKDDAGRVYMESDSAGGGNIYLDFGQVQRLPVSEWEQTMLASFGPAPIYAQLHQTFQYITQRWQLLDENFLPPQSLPTGVSGDLMVIDRCADNVPLMLDFLHKVEPSLYAELQADLKWLLAHVATLETESDDRETRFFIREGSSQDQEAPTISAGTVRLVAILTAYHVLNFKSRAQMAGLVVVEEPDTALNPWLLSRFVEQLRNYVDREYLRQFILTTHNPRLLDHFQPEEVRIVQRDERGYTTVERVPEYIRDIWLDEYGLGQVWSTGSLGAAAQ
ncbi:MAG: hypothetical protein DCC55_08215 [Chloroflexi bacterium]|nr:MAG: hypothetical protein DCC55_08215 [Chloroflexota bacterium]